MSGQYLCGGGELLLSRAYSVSKYGGRYHDTGHGAQQTRILFLPTNDE